MDKLLQIHDSHVVLVLMSSIYNKEYVLIFVVTKFTEPAHKSILLQHYQYFQIKKNKLQLESKISPV